VSNDIVELVADNHRPCKVVDFGRAIIVCRLLSLGFSLVLVLVLVLVFVLALLGRRRTLG
jgi:hypothetical protein